ncbi:MAG TPA: hypothetical protein VIJ50_03850 [Solirubrobacteraceae bacterium]
MTGAIVLGLLVLVAALLLTLSGSPLIVAQTNGVPATSLLAEGTSGARACQSRELLPAGTSAIRLTLVAAVGPRVSVTVLSGTRTLTSGVTRSGWTSGAVTVPVKPFQHAVSNVTICLELGPAAEAVALSGERTSRAAAARLSTGVPLSGRFTVEYMKPGYNSWWGLESRIATRIGFGRAPSGSWVALLLLLLMGISVATAIWLLVEDLR